MKKFTEILIEYFLKLNINLPKNLSIKSIKMDSNKVEKGSLFIAINNGNNFINDALKNGAEIVISDRQIIDDPRVVKVSDSIKFLQEIAQIYRKKLNLKIISITGSEGKTTTKDLVYGILSTKYKCKKTMGNYNNHIGLPFTILQFEDDDEIGILEMGMSNLGEIDLLSKISQPDYAIITNIGDSHLEYLKNRDNVFKAKTEVLKYVNKNNVLVYGDDLYLKKLDALKIGFQKNNDYIISNEKELYEGVKFKLNESEYFVPLNGLHNVINSSFAIVLGKIFQMSEFEIKNSLKEVKITSMRFEKIEKDGILYINDAYNASPVSMQMALKTFSSLPLVNRKKVLVLADALELGDKEIEYHKNILLESLEYDFYKIFVYGERMKKALEILNDSRILHFTDKNLIKNELEKMKNIAVLLKGSRGMRLEDIMI